MLTVGTWNGQLMFRISLPMQNCLHCFWLSDLEHIYYVWVSDLILMCLSVTNWNIFFTYMGLHFLCSWLLRSRLLTFSVFLSIKQNLILSSFNIQFLYVYIFLKKVIQIYFNYECVVSILIWYILWRFFEVRTI